MVERFCGSLGEAGAGMGLVVRIAVARRKEGPICGQASGFSYVRRGGYLAEAARALARKNSGTTPSCCRRLKASQLT